MVKTTKMLTAVVAIAGLVLALAPTAQAALTTGMSSATNMGFAFQPSGGGSTPGTLIMFK